MGFGESAAKQRTTALNENREVTSLRAERRGSATFVAGTIAAEKIRTAVTGEEEGFEPTIGRQPARESVT